MTLGLLLQLPEEILWLRYEGCLLFFLLPLEDDLNPAVFFSTPFFALCFCEKSIPITEVREISEIPSSAEGKFGGLSSSNRKFD